MLGNESAPVELMTTFSSKGSPGKALASLPVAITLFIAVIVYVFPSLPITLLSKIDIHRCMVDITRNTLQICDFVLPEQSFNAFGEGSDDRFLCLLSLLPINFDTLNLDTHFLEIVFGLVKLMGDVEQCFGGNAAHVQARPSESASLLDADGVQSLLSCFDGSHITCIMGELPPGPPPMIATSKIFVENRNVL
jgi:hypothetical protein